LTEFPPYFALHATREAKNRLYIYCNRKQVVKELTFLHVASSSSLLHKTHILYPSPSFTQLRSSQSIPSDRLDVVRTLPPVMRNSRGHHRIIGQYNYLTFCIRSKWKQIDGMNVSLQRGIGECRPHFTSLPSSVHHSGLSGVYEAHRGILLEV